MSLNLNKSTEGNYTVENYEYSAESINAPGQQKETRFSNSNFTKYYGTFKQNSELKSTFTMRAIWNCGKGVRARNIGDQIILDKIRGNGKETFYDILLEMDIMRMINGDSYCEIIRNPQTGKVINLKFIDPQNMVIIYDEKGIIKGYEQTNKATNQKMAEWKPNEIFHLSNARFGAMGGISDIEALEKILLADAESFEDTKTIVHRGARPLILWKLKTDDQTKINAFIAKIENARKLGNDMFIPDDDDTVTHEILQVDANPTILQWRETLKDKFYRNSMLPQLVAGAGGLGTESDSKVIYFAFSNLTEYPQGYLERQIKNQLGLDVELIPPASLQNELAKDEGKDGALGFQSNDLTVGSGQ